MSNKYGHRTLNWFEAIVNKLDGEEGAERFLRGELVLKASDLLKQIATAPVGDANKFVAKDHIKAANVVWMSDNFKRLFLGRVEENVEAAILNVYRLEKASLDAPILAELGERARISLTHFFELLEKQSRGEAGPFLTNGYATIAYIIGGDGNIWAVCADWYGGGWGVGAGSVGRPYGWRDGIRVLAR